MSGRAKVQAQERRPVLQGTELQPHASVRPVDGQSLRLSAPGFAHDLSRVTTDGASRSLSCPVYPRTCPFGGACHTCPTRVQTKLAINEPGDVYEQEADRVAEQVMRMATPEEDEKACSLPRCSGTVQRKAVTGTVVDGVPPIVHEVLRSPGQPLDAATRAFMEARFDRDLGDVRVHTDTAAAKSAQALNALAYTVGGNVVFGTARYAPQTTRGKQLLAHELAHTVQQCGRCNAGGTSSNWCLSDRSMPGTGRTDKGTDGVRSDQVSGLIYSGPSREPNLLQRAVDYDECTSAEETVVLASHNRAIDMVANAVTKLDTYNGTTPTDVKTALDTHFHSSGTGLAASIASNLDALKRQADSPTYECEKPQVGSRLGFSIWCVPWTDIELYPLWFAESDIDKRASTMIHEWAHRYGCHFDLGYEGEAGYSEHGTLRSLLNADPWAEFVYDVR